MGSLINRRNEYPSGYREGQGTTGSVS